MKGKLHRLLILGLILALIPFQVSLAEGLIQITTADLTPGLELNASWLILRPSSGNLDYAILTTPLSNPSPTPSWQIQSIKPGYKSGFNLGAGYVFPNCWSDMQLNWSHLNSNHSRSTFAENTQFVAPFFQVGPDSGTLKEARGKAHFHYDIVNLDFGAFMSVCGDLQLRFFGGLSGAELKLKLHSTFRDSSPNFFFSSRNYSKFTGLGPRLGISAAYDIVDCFCIVGQMAGSMLVGNQRLNTSYIANSSILNSLGVNPNRQGINSKTAHQVVPALDAKLGLNYSFLLANNSLFTVEAGYQAATFLNAIASYNPQSLFVVPPTPLQTGTFAVATMEKKQSHFSVDGPYLNFKLGF
jgi:hypothetical protein